MPAPRTTEAAWPGGLPLAVVLTVVLTAGWTFVGWSDLTRLILPDTDDMMRLVQIRDWLDGQAFADLSQRRVAGLADGLPMHWSRLPDLVPALVMRLLAPALGQTRAELAAVIFWPELLFLCHLLLVAALARRLSGAGATPVALLLGALAFPAIGMFIPGRIDHHGLQIVLVEGLALSLVAGRLFAAGLAAGTSLLVGLESAPAILAAMVALGWLWIESARRVLGFGLGLLGATLAGFALLRPMPWSTEWCDSFTPGLFALMMIASAGWLLLAGLAPRLPDPRWRAGVAIVLAGFAGLCGWATAPECLRSPYGLVDPLLARLWLGAVGEAGGLLRQSPGVILAYAGLSVVALGWSLRVWAREPERRATWLAPMAILVASLLVSLVQLRGIWFAAALAPALLAHAVLRARVRGVGALLLAWLASAGLVWQTAGDAVARVRPTVRSPEVGAASGPCTDQRLVRQLDRLATGTVAAAIDLGPYLLAATDHRVLAAPYHRNNRGNRAMYDVFLSTPEAARYQAGLWTVDYVVLCPDSLDEVPADMVKPNSLLALLRAGAAPNWLEPIYAVDGGARVFRVLPGAIR